MSWCEANAVDYVIGSPRARLLRRIKRRLKQARRRFAKTGTAARAFADFRYRTRKSWPRARRVVAKAEYLAKGANPRFVVTSLSAERRRRNSSTRRSTVPARDGKPYQGAAVGAVRGPHLDAELRSNQIRLYSAIAYCVLEALRRLGLADEARAHRGRSLRLLKIGARIRITARKVWISLATGYAPGSSNKSMTISREGSRCPARRQGSSNT